MADGIRATPYRSSFAGSANDILGGLLGYMRDPRRTQQMQGLAGLLESTGIPKTVERLAYGEPLTNLQKANVPTLRPETAEALMTLLPVPSGASRAARAVDPVVQKYGPKLEQSLLPAFEAAYNRGGLTREMVEAMGTGVQSPLTVYHGSPAKFNKFDSTKIGSGEGAQAYGYGHYVAESPGVAKDYQSRLSELPFPSGDERNAVVRLIESKGKSGEDQAKKYLAPKYGDDNASKMIQEAKEAAEKGRGSFYEIDLPDEQIARMLDWDKPLMQQSKEIQSLAKQYGLTDADHMGGDLIAAMDAKRAAGAEAMRQAGVPGIRYLDQGSRGTGEGTSNFVVFPGNEGLLTIQKRNNEVIAPASLLDYRGSHTAPGPDFGAPLHDLTGGGQMYPADVYSPKAAQYYGTGYAKADKEAFDLARRVKGNPDAEVTMYRAVPNNKDISEINVGDWVTLSQDYAKNHGDSVFQGEYKILKKKVKAKDLWTNADSIHEFGYHPQ